MNLRPVAVQVLVGGEHETRSVENMTKLVAAGYRHGIPVLGVTAVGKAGRHSRREEAAGAGGAPRWPTCRAGGAAGVDLGGNIFQPHAPAAMIQAVAKVVHDDLPAPDAYALCQELAHDAAVAA
jgi:putative autoinducer-2 (AI-2) aldolase